MSERRETRASLVLPGFINPLLMMAIALGSLLLLSGYFVEMGPFIYTSPRQNLIDDIVGYLYLALAVILYFVVGFVYEKPIRGALRLLRANQQPPEALLSLARLRAMNAPAAYACVTAAIWVFGMMLMPFALAMLAPPVLKSYWVTGVLLSFFVGAFTLVIAYFAVSVAAKYYFLPALFPLGHLDTQVGGHSLSVRTRLHLIFVSICVLPLLLNLCNAVVWRRVILPEAGGSALTAERMADYAVTQSLHLSVFCASVGLALVVLFGLEMRRSLLSIADVVEGVHGGDLSRHVSVCSRDEIGALGDRVNEMIIGLRERKRIIEAFNRYVDRTLTRQVLDGRLALGGVNLEVSILFCDIRGYTSLSEGMEPGSVVAMLNRYFTCMAGAIEEAGGAVNKFIGDAILAVFGAPEPQIDHRDRAIRAARAMYGALHKFNSSQRELGQPAISIGIGVHSGLVLAGNIGSENKIEYTVIGDAVNVARRLEELTAEKNVPIICSGMTLGPYMQRYAHESLGLVQLKGRADTVDIYSLMPACASQDASA